MRNTPWLSLPALAGAALLAQPAQAQTAPPAPELNLGSLVYEPVEPCRLLDTRSPTATGGNLVAGTAQSFDAYGADLSAQGGSATGCEHPRAAENLAPVAIAANVTAVGLAASGAGNIVAYPTGAQTAPTASLVNFRPGTNIANSTIIALCEPGSATDTKCDPGDFDLLANFSGVPAVIDVQGYFYPRNLNNEITVSKAGGTSPPSPRRCSS